MAVSTLVDLSRYDSLQLTYSEVGRTAGPLPTGYHHVDRREPIGHGRDGFRAAADALVSWGMHRGAGLSVDATSGAAEVGSTVLMRIGPVRIPCRVVAVIDEPNRRGFAYGTLPGHPEQGEELFVVEFDPDSRAVTAHIAAFSRPGRWFTRLGGPLGRVVQRLATDRYFAALRRAAF
ncbi:DUF1990 domain-containing protein [Rhodococcoides yunnanense]|uniref:DUF1990 domain-containing protein n=1 Tax=Rhodococcoides yunnanense TaxID=278209 RepID=UPI0009322E67|nr:DUF1990 domain-containing protein [Rhodococcus yunnanensis]